MFAAFMWVSVFSCPQCKYSAGILLNLTILDIREILELVEVVNDYWRFLVQERRNSIAKALEFRLSCTT